MELSLFYYPMTLHRNSASGPTVATWTNSLPLVQDVVESVYVLTNNDPLLQGLYTWDGMRFRYTLPYQQVCAAIIGGAAIDIYYAIDTVSPLPTNAQVWRNGLPYTDANFTAGDGAVWALLVFPISAAGDVKSVNKQPPDATGNVTIQAANANGATGTSLIVNSGANTGTMTFKTLVAGSGITLSSDPNGNLEISGANQYVLPPAGTTPQTLGGVYVTDASTGIILAGDGRLSLRPASAAALGVMRAGSGLSVDANGVVSVTAVGGVSSVSGQTGAVVVSTVNNNATTGTSLITDTGATTGTAKLKTLVPGTLITFATDANGNLVINSTATSGALTAVNSEGTGTSLVDNNGTSGGIATIKSLAAGSNITITPSGDAKTLTITANQVLQPATTTTIGGVIIKTGLSVDGAGNLSLAAPIGVNIGGVKAGTGVTIASDGTISATGNVTSVSGQTGVVVISAVDTNGSSGTSLITSSGATTGTIAIRRIVAGTGITLATDANNNLQISSTATGGVSSIATSTSGALTGAIVLQAGPSISLSNSGNTIQISGTGVPEAPNDGNLYGRENGGWTLIPSAGSAITSVTGQTGTNAVLLVEANPPANSAIIKSLVAGTNVTLSDVGGLVTITAAIPAGTVATVNTKAPNTSGNVTLAAADVGALPIVGGTMQGAINMSSNGLTGVPNPVNATDAVNYQTLQGLAIDGGVIG